MALQRIVLHGNLDPKYSRGRGGRQRTYKQCIKDALGNFGVTMAQCMDMERQDWDAVIEGAGLETAVQQWEIRPKASRPIDVEWRTKAVRDSGRKKRTSTEAADLDRNEDNNNESSASSAADSEEEDEFAEVTTME